MQEFKVKFNITSSSSNRLLRLHIRGIVGIKNKQNYNNNKKTELGEGEIFLEKLRISIWILNRVGFNPYNDF